MDLYTLATNPNLPLDARYAIARQMQAGRNRLPLNHTGSYTAEDESIALRYTGKQAAELLGRTVKAIEHKRKGIRGRKRRKEA